MKRVFILSGEASSDIHGANLVKSLKSLYKDDIEFTGIGGKAMLSTGFFAPEYLNNDFAVCGGIGEIYKKISKIFKAYFEIKKRAKLGSYDLFILLDYPEFNLRLAKYLTKISVPVIYYITPQVWAWRSYRVRMLNKYSRELICVFKFELDFFKIFGVKAKYFGHPIVDEINNFKNSFNLDIFKEKLKINQNDKIICLMPGSRNSEVTKNLPTMLESIIIINKKFKNIKYYLPAASTVDLKLIKEIINSYNLDINIHTGSSYEILSIADYAITVSGTSTLECALFNVPMSIVYKVSFLSYAIFKYLIRYNKPIGMSNLVLNRDLNNLAFNEFLQDDFKKENLAQDVISFLKNKKQYDLIFKEIEKIIYEHKSPSLSVAKYILKYL